MIDLRIKIFKVVSLSEQMNTKYSKALQKFYSGFGDECEQKQQQSIILCSLKDMKTSHTQSQGKFCADESLVQRRM